MASSATGGDTQVVGLELLYNSISSSLTSRLDALVATFHWFIIQAGAKCVKDGSSKTTELLPPGWNSNQNDYLLEYAVGSRRLKLKVIKMDESALIHLMEDGSEKVVCLNVSVSSVISKEFTDFDQAYVNLQSLYKQFKSEMRPVISPEKEEKQQTSTESALQEDSLRDDRSYGPMNPGQDRFGIPSYDPSGIGVGDLDPLRAGQGGMIFDPLRGGHRPGPHPNAGISGRIPLGSIPPGARFDPFGPDLGGRGPFRFGPNNDHMPPPGFM